MHYSTSGFATTSDLVTKLYNKDPEIQGNSILQTQTWFAEPDSKVNTDDEAKRNELQIPDIDSVTQHNLLDNEIEIDEVTRSSGTSHIIDRYAITRCEEVNTDTKKINWNDIFDTEILSPTTKIEDVEHGKFTCEDMNTKLESDMPAIQVFADSTAEASDGQKKGIKIISNEVIQPGILNKRSSKKRKSQAKITDVLPKKVKKIKNDCKKLIDTSFRKQSYNKTVNNWLESVTPCQKVEEEKLPEEAVLEKPVTKVSSNNVDKKAEGNIQKRKPAKTFEGNKRVIQAQLANKDGVMKFKVPNPELEKQCIKTTDDSSKCSKPDSTDIAVIDKSKDTTAKVKKVKSKFVAPFKTNSQIPIKDITYDIVLIDGLNFVEHRKNILSEENGEEIIFVLLYRNGFNQLSRHHTDDSCVPEGLMLKVGENFYYTKHTDFPDPTAMRELFLSILTTKNVVCYDGKEILIYLATEYKLDLVEQQIKMADAQIAGRLLEAEEPPPPTHFGSLQALAGPAAAAQYRVQSACGRQRCAWLARQLQAAAAALRAALAEQNLARVFWDIEMRILPVIADMERRGVGVDLQRLREMEATLEQRLQQAEAECHRAAGRVFQINSAPQVRALLYDELRLDAQLKQPVPTTHGTGAKSTAETVLRQLAAVGQHALPRLVLEYRRLQKARSTFIAGVLQHAAAGTVRPVWEQIAATTGRAACSGPNLQAIPRVAFPLAPYTGRGDPGPSLNLRSVYCARAGHTLLAADFRHVECRVFAHAARDQRLLHALAQPGDLFRLLASDWLRKPAAAVSAEERERTKRVVYASLYGAGAGTLAAILAGGAAAGAAGAADGGEGDADTDAAPNTLDVVASFHRAFPSLRSFGRSVTERCVAGGGRLATVSGRARRLAGVSAADHAARAHAQRQALNFIIQGTAADLCKVALAESCAALRAAAPPVPARLLLMVHDELVWELPPAHLRTAAEIIRCAMEGCGRQLDIDVPLPVSLSHGRTWGDLEPLV